VLSRVDATTAGAFLQTRASETQRKAPAYRISLCFPDKFYYIKSHRRADGSGAGALPDQGKDDVSAALSGGRRGGSALRIASRAGAGSGAGGASGREGGGANVRVVWAGAVVRVCAGGRLFGFGGVAAGDGHTLS